LTTAAAAVTLETCRIRRTDKPELRLTLTDPEANTTEWIYDDLDRVVDEENGLETSTRKDPLAIQGHLSFDQSLAAPAMDLMLRNEEKIKLFQRAFFRHILDQ